MSDQLDHRVTKLEFRVDGHDKDIEQTKTVQTAMSKSLNAIQQNLTQIKWLVTGAAGALTFKALDINGLLKLLLTAF
uniref:Uncharacterized protein n=1 Tax=Ralstonia phage BOESR1 TaxID=3034917 RepID=A0AA49EPW0_9CAUD|nr:hypothetical protein HIBIKMCM_00051 [Ralstonia phage BOESR1]